MPPSSTENILESEDSDAKELYEKYKLGKELGRGQFGVTFLATCKTTKKEWACKTISKRKLLSPEDREDVRNEVAIMLHLNGHDNIVRLEKAYEDRLNVQLLMELAKGGELFDRIVEKGHYTEKAAATAFRAIMTMVAQCHALGVLHRDLKPENFLLSSKEENATIKATDFGLSTFFKPGQKFKEVVGSAYYVAPEVLKKNYGPEADTWSAGVILYILLCGVPPFWAESDQGVFKAVMRGKYDLESAPWNKISDGAKDCVRRLLKQNPAERMTPLEALNHPWLREGGSAPDDALEDTIVKRLKKFSEMNRFKKTALSVIASNMSEPEIKGLQQTFSAIDKDNSGTITLDELMAGLRELADKNTEKIGRVKRMNAMAPAEVEALLDAVDTDKSGTISYQEFITATIHMNKLEREEVLWETFQTFDKDGNGFISQDEVQEALQQYGGGAVSDEEAAHLIAEADTNKDGLINYEEFTAMMRSSGKSAFATPKVPRRGRSMHVPGKLSSEPRQ